MSNPEYRPLDKIVYLLGRKIKVILVEDHEMFREGMALLLSTIPYLEVVGSFSNSEGLKVYLLINQEPDVIFMDIKLKEESGVDLTHYVKIEYPKIRIIALSMYDNPNIVLKIIGAGASGYLLKDVTKEELKDAVTAVMNGDEYFCKDVANLLMSHAINKESKKGNREINMRGFTMREVQIIRLICDGKSNKDIATSLYLSIRTVETHRLRIMRKMQVNSAADLITFAIRNGIYHV